jgi:pSer/pThr/pTyr-binding forkhead associated (FHA) protein
VGALPSPPETPGPAHPQTTGKVGPEKLVVLSPTERKGMEFPLRDEVTVGRAGGCAVLLADDTFVSQLHARVFRRDGDLYVEDLGSTNGTYLNRKKVTAPVPIRKGDKVQFGRTTMEVRK